MLTLLGYVLIVGVVAGVLFLLASVVFGRGEELGPLPEGTTATVLPAESITGADVRALRFQQVVRGYKAGEVDWALARLAARIDELQAELAQARAATAPASPTQRTAVPPEDTPTEVPRPRTVETTGPRPADPTASPADRARTDPPVSNGRTQP
ncbi:DivIVA domain-containing protein [Nocardia higoensis]|uniref:DivIVA domain-containing protein n=1 Tax=Nocardia higoensis TaxID=228599 RepID=UPI003A5D04EC